MVKKILSLFITLVIASVCLGSCSNSTGTDEKPAAQQDGTASTQTDDNKDDKKTVKPAVEFKIAENDTFAYVDDSGILKFRNIKDNSEQKLTDNKNVFDYDFNFKDNMAAYVVHMEKDSVEGKLYILNMDTMASEELNSNDTTPRKVDWSKDGRYLAVDHGTSPTGFTRIYDANVKKWLYITGPIESGILNNGYIWSPHENALAMTVPEEVEPSTPVGDGSSMSIAVYSVDKNSYNVLLKGASDYGFGVLRWADAKNVYIKKMFFTDFEKKEYYKLNVDDETLTGVNEAEALGQDNSTNLPEEVANSLYDVSPDGKLVLYDIYDKSESKFKVMLWDAAKQEKKEICIGSYPKWITME